MSRGLSSLTKKEKRDILKNKGNILETKDGRRKSFMSGSMSPTKKTTEMNDILNNAKANNVPVWDAANKKWMGPDQMTVETVFRQPRVDSGSSKRTSGSPLSDNLDGRLLHMENF